MSTIFPLKSHLVHITTHRVLGGGIVYDSDPYDEWVETMNKLRANMTCVTEAEKRHSKLQSGGAIGEPIAEK